MICNPAEHKHNSFRAHGSNDCDYQMILQHLQPSMPSIAETKVKTGSCDGCYCIADSTGDCGAVMEGAQQRDGCQGVPQAFQPCGNRGHASFETHCESGQMINRPMGVIEGEPDKLGAATRLSASGLSSR